MHCEPDSSASSPDFAVTLTLQMLQLVDILTLSTSGIEQLLEPFPTTVKVHTTQRWGCQTRTLAVFTEIARRRAPQQPHSFCEGACKLSGIASSCQVGPTAACLAYTVHPDLHSQSGLIS